MVGFLEREGVRIIRTPARAPNCNAYAERFVRSIKEECLNRVLLLGERHLRRTIAEFVAHYHAERNHQGIGNELIQPAARADGLGVVRRRQRMGGMLNFYYRGPRSRVGENGWAQSFDSAPPTGRLDPQRPPSRQRQVAAIRQRRHDDALVGQYRYRSEYWKGRIGARCKSSRAT